ncbi:hypothetical protein EVC45_33995 [Paraburkholderia sp. UYCP14C]|uniref:hypothetical protein n=1 Tax=Paraburkholderia sp. UYCP14C TaxID=2511130 RepID=UPI001020FDAC|nr:hypothetical protein [Paraburkholderia sp. UYCP14C]RZF25318.1 hypothetical protein EVC45_33995 [Paraburkholderia sp. UYCP14C]
MRTDHTAAELAQPQPLPRSSLDDANETLSQPPVRALTRIAFCFAWLFGLEPFLATPSDDPRDSRRGRH